MTQIVVEIDCDGVFCGDCKMLRTMTIRGAALGFCRLFGVDPCDCLIEATGTGALSGNSDGKWLRHRECMEANHDS
jgi:hypothetical protein